MSRANHHLGHAQGGQGFRGPHPNTIYVANFSSEIHESDIRKLFSSYEDLKISDIKIRDNKAFAFVTFGSREDAKEAIDKFAGREFQGRNLIVDWSNKAGESRSRLPKSGQGAPFREKSPEPGKRYKKESKYRESSESGSRSRSRGKKDRERKKHSRSRSRSHEKYSRKREYNYFNDPRVLLKMIADGKSKHGSGVYEKIAGERLQKMINSKY